MFCIFGIFLDPDGLARNRLFKNTRGNEDGFADGWMEGGGGGNTKKVAKLSC